MNPGQRRIGGLRTTRGLLRATRHCPTETSGVENTQIGPFRLLSKLGASRRHRVYHARQVEQNRDVALKFITIPPKYDWNKALDKLQSEFESLRSLRHIHLAQVYGAGVEGQQIFMATELVPGDSLSSILARRGRLAPDLAVEYARQIALCLDYLHSNQLLHCKLTPDKIIVGAGDQIKITDLRLNRSKRSRWDRTNHRELELAAYLAPEQLGGLPTNKSDLYSLGVVMFEMLTGRIPFEPENIAKLNRNKNEQTVPSVASTVLNCPVWLDRLVTQLIQPKPKNRPHSARAVVMALQEIQKIDESQMAAVDQIAGNFNPLNANANREEARELLSRTTGSSTRTTKFHWATISVIVLAFVTFAIVAYFMLPPSNSSILSRSTRLVNTDSPGNWATARDLSAFILEHPTDETTKAKAGQVYSRARRRILLNQAEKGIKNNLQSVEVQTFIDAYQLEKENAIEEAFKLYKQLLVKADKGGKEAYVVEEAKIRRDELMDLAELPGTELELLSLIEDSQSIHNAPELRRSYRQMEQIMLRFADKAELSEVVLQASQRMKEIKQELARQLK